MAKIIQSTVTRLTRPHAVLTTSYGKEKQEKSHAIVTLIDENGVTGYGEATPLSNFTGETTEIVAEVLNTILLPKLIGYDSSNIAQIHQMMDAQIAENHAAKCAIDCAMYDLTAKELGTPLYTLLGGKCRDRVPINRHLGIMPVEQVVLTAKEYVAQGYRSIKMKVGGDAASNAERIKAVREAVGPQIRLRIDGNCGFSRSEAWKLIEMVWPFDLEFYEQLLPKWDMEGMHNLRVAFGIPVLADEAVNSVQDAVRFAAHGAADAMTIKLCKCGGLYPAMQVAGVAASLGMQVVVASTYDTHIGCSACLHLATALPNISAGCDLTTFATQPAYAKTAHTLDGMYMSAGVLPGIGVASMADFPMPETTETATSYGEKRI